MPAKRRRAKTTSEPIQPPCQHGLIQTEPSAHATEVGYTQPPALQRAKAQGLKSLELSQFTDNPSTFPGPLVLPDDDLALDPKYPGQSLLSYTRLKDRNAVTNTRRTIYIAAPPQIDHELSFAESWSTPKLPSPAHDKSHARLHTSPSIIPPTVKDVADYTRAFYHPLPVKVLPTSTFKFVSWSRPDTLSLQSTDSATQAAIIGLQTSTEMIGIRTRATPDQHVNAFTRQLNLNDILDAAISSLPSDAFALLLLVNQDLYEDEDDDFVCGRAYGGSRVAVVSSARYNPVLDAALALDLEHVWPMSHCAEYISGIVGLNHGNKKSKKQRTPTVLEDNPSATALATLTPIQAAISAVLTFRNSCTPGNHTAIWLSRMCRTVVHELGHCFGIDHCVYYACCMQGSASLHEDARQPPYLCPVDLAKVLKATGASEGEHLTALGACCRRFGNGEQRDEMFVAFAAWLALRLEQLNIIGC